MSKPTIITLEHDELQMLFSLYHGASILALNHKPSGEAILRQSPEHIKDMREVACFPLLPHCHRIGNGIIAANSPFNPTKAAIHLKPNMLPEPHHIHGVGWKSHDWELLEQKQDSITVGLDYKAGEWDKSWPFSFYATLTYRLQGSGLMGSMELTNHHDTPAPFGLGFHPYFPKTRHSSLKAKVGRVMQVDDAMMPISIDEDDILVKAIKAGELLEHPMDHCFSQWDGKAIIQQENHHILLENRKNFPCLQCYVPSEYEFSQVPFFCAEPVMHLPNVINFRDDVLLNEDMRLLSPQQSLQCEFSLQYYKGDYHE